MEEVISNAANVRLRFTLNQSQSQMLWMWILDGFFCVINISLDSVKGFKTMNRNIKVQKVI